jgi:hypothetical protein
MPRPSRQRSIPYVEDFIRTLLADVPVIGDEGISKAAWWIAWPQKGTLLLDAEELARYTTVVDQLLAEFVKFEDLSRRSVEARLKDTILTAWDPTNESGKPFDDRLRAAVLDLRESLASTSAQYRLFVIIDGFNDFEKAHLIDTGPGPGSTARSRRRRSTGADPVPP